MPTIFVWRGLRFFFYSNEGGEPPHVYVRGGGREAKIWLASLTIARNRGFASQDIPDIVAEVSRRKDALADAWRRHFGR